VEADDFAGSIFDEELPNALHSVFSGTEVFKAMSNCFSSSKEGTCGTGGVDMDGGERAERIFSISGAERHFSPESESERSSMPWKSGNSGSTFSTRLEDIDFLTFMDEIGGVSPIMVLVTLVELNLFGALVTADDVLDEDLVLAITEWLLFQIFESELDKLECGVLGETD
jgi:hypothetical protein